MSLYKQHSPYKALKALESFLFKGDVNPNHILKGDQLGSLPPNSKTFVVNTVLNDVGHGMPIRKMVGDRWEMRELMEVNAQVDIYSEDSETARNLAQSLKTFVFSGEAVDFLRPYGFSVLYADNVRNLTAVGSDGIPLPRWTTTLKLSYWHLVGQPIESFNSVTVDAQNVDVLYKPKHEDV